MTGFSGFSDCHGSVVQPTVPTVEAPIEDEWYPTIDPAQLRREHRIGDDAKVAPDRLRAAILAALVAVDNQLGAWAAAQTLAGHATMADVPARHFDGQSRLVISFHRAIGALTKVELIEKTRDLDTTPAGDRDAAALDPSIVELRRDAAFAISDILAQSRTTVELL